MSVTIYHGDCVEVLRTIEPESIDACVTDPPYGIGFMGKEWDTFKPGVEQSRIVANAAIESDNPNLRGRTRSPAQSPSQVEYDYSAKGLRGFQAWTEQWAREVFRVLKPGGYLLVCGAPRSFHRMACGIEDAGFEIRDCLSWLFGSGFPKSLDLSKAIDRELGKPRAVAGVGASIDRTALDMGGATGKAKNGLKAEWIETEPNTADAQRWDGWGTALKPGWEPIVVARKPIKGTVAANVLKYGTGGLHIDACRIDGPVGDGHWSGDDGSDATSRPGYEGGFTKGGQRAAGRWPANVALDEDAAFMLDEQSGTLTSGDPCGVKAGGQGNAFGHFNGGILVTGFGDSGGASRFFYVAKPDRAERDQGTEGLRPRQRDESRKEGNPGGDNPRNRGLQRRGNFHPTVKPVDLMCWLVRLVTRPGGTVVDPFLGSGTTGIACVHEGMSFIGIEREAEYIELAEARIRGTAPLFAEPGVPREQASSPTLTLFEEL